MLQKTFAYFALASLILIGPVFDIFTSAQVPAPIEPNVFVRLSNRVVPSVVNISTLTTIQNPTLRGGTPDDVLKKFFGDLFRQYHSPDQEPDQEGEDGNRGRGDSGGESDDRDNHDEENEQPQPRAQAPKAMSLGTGFIIDSSGLILTNNHVVADADEIKISFTEATDELPTAAEVVGRDLETDVALIRVKNKRKMVPLTFGNSDELDVGEYVAAVGNPFGQGHSVTHGIISAKGRQAPDFPLANYLQTDAPINPGNSGGPLVNLKGEVIGINNAIDQRAQGIGFAIPINLVKVILPQLRANGFVSRGYIGLLAEDLTPEIASKIGAPNSLKRPFISHVYKDAPAALAGLKPYDVILEFKGKKIQTYAELITEVTSQKVGETVPVKVLRAGKEKVLKIKIQQRPSGDPKPKKEKKSKKKKGDENQASELKSGLTVEKQKSQLVVTGVEEESAADRAGLSSGDVILEVDQKPMKNVEQFYKLLNKKKSYLLRIKHKDSDESDNYLITILDLKESTSSR